MLTDVWQGKITSTIAKSGFSADMKLDNILVYGVAASPSQVTVDGQTAQFQYKADTKVCHRCLHC